MEGHPEPLEVQDVRSYTSEAEELCVAPPPRTSTRASPPPPPECGAAPAAAAWASAHRGRGSEGLAVDTNFLSTLPPVRASLTLPSERRSLGSDRPGRRRSNSTDSRLTICSDGIQESAAFAAAAILPSTVTALSTRASLSGGAYRSPWSRDGSINSRISKVWAGGEEETGFSREGTLLGRQSSSGSFFATTLASSATFQPLRRMSSAMRRSSGSVGSVIGERPFLVRPPKTSPSGRLKPVDVTPPSRLALRCNRILQVLPVQALMMALTLMVMYLVDFFQSVADARSDPGVSYALMACLSIFAVEWVLNIISSPAQSPRYRWSFYFALDFVALVSLAVDTLLLEANNLADNGPLAKFARAVRLGTRAGRSVRFTRALRFLRLVRITRLLKAILATRDLMRLRRRRTRELEQGEVPQTEEEDDTHRADTIGAQIGAQSTKKVVTMTLLLLLVLPFLDSDDSAVLCNGELVEAFKMYAATLDDFRNCTSLQAQTREFFGAGGAVVEFSRRPNQGLTSGGLMYVLLDGCLLFYNAALTGSPPSLDRIATRRRATEIQVVPCDADFMDTSGGNTFFMYDMREERIEDAAFSMGFTSVVVVVLLIFSVIFSSDAESLANKLALPLTQLMQDMLHAAKLELHLVADVEDWPRSDVVEVRTLQGTFYNLLCAIGSFSKFTPLEVVRHFLSLGAEAQLGVEDRNITIFFSDIAGFAQACEGTPPKEVLVLLGDYFEQMVSIIGQEGGTMLEFIGDAILAVWNAPQPVPDHAVRAMTAALRMNKLLETLRHWWPDQDKPPLRIRAGMHSANVYVGNLGARMRMKYGVLGDGVNLASRLEELNKRYGTTLLVSEDVLDQPGVRSGFVLRLLDLVVVKGRTNPTRIYEVLETTARASELLLLIQAEAAKTFNAYLERDFEEAARHLCLIQELKGGKDPPGELLLDRCRRFLAKPPPPEWDGAEVLTQKTF